MRIIVYSDTHGKLSSAYDIFDRNRSADAFIFLGDGEKEFDSCTEMFPDKRAVMVRGNCDYGSTAPEISVFCAEDYRILYTHGHSFNVKYSSATLLRLAEENKAQVVLFGHTHCRCCEYHDGIYLLNPGSATCPRDGKSPSYAFIDITKAGIFCSHVDLP